MGTYPKQYSQAAIIVAEEVVKTTVESRLVKSEWRWGVPYFLVSGTELDSIRSRFAPGVSEDELVRFIGLVFSKTLPLIHYEFTSDGYCLAIDGPRSAPAVIIRELPQGSHGYQGAWQQTSYTAALAAVRALLEWTILDFRETHGETWPISEWGGAPLIHGELYRWIKGLGKFSYCRTRYVIEFIREAAPDLFDEWEREGLVLTPTYHIERDGRDRFTTLGLEPKPPA